MCYRLLHDDMKESGLLPVTGRLLKSFNFAYQPRSHAVDLVQALHVILRMLDRLNTSGTWNRLNTSGISCYVAPSTLSHAWMQASQPWHETTAPVLAPR